MKRLEIKNDDCDLFDTPLHPILYSLYRENTKEIRRMVKQQSQGFWIQFLTSFREFHVASKEMKEVIKEEKEICEVAFLDMLKILTTENCFTVFTSLMESVRTVSMLLEGLRGRILFSFQLFKALEISKFEKPLATLPLYTRFVSAIVLLYRRWKHAPRVRERVPPAKWIPPQNWYQQCEPSAYEKYLWENWGVRLYKILGLERREINIFEKRELPVPDSRKHNTKSNVTKSDANMNRESEGKSSTGRNRRRRRKRRSTNNTESVDSAEIDWSNTASIGTATDTSSPAGDLEVNMNDPETSSKKPSKEGACTGTIPKNGLKKDTFQYGKLFKFGENGTNKNESTSKINQEKLPQEDNSSVNYLDYKRMFNLNTGKSENKTKVNSEKVNENRIPEREIVNESSGGFNKSHNFSKDKAEGDQSSEVENGRVNKSGKSNTFKYDRLFSFSSSGRKTGNNTADNCKPTKSPNENSGKKIAQDTSSKGKKREEKEKGRDDMENKASDSLMYEKMEEKEKDRDDTENKASDSFMYDRLFNFSKKEGNNFQSENSCFHNKGCDSEDDYEEVGYDEGDSNDSYSDNEYEDYSPFFNQFGREYLKEKHKRERMAREANILRRRPVIPVRKFLLQNCSNCNILEKTLGQHEECKYCVVESTLVPKVYCDTFCRRVHWEKIHQFTHHGMFWQE